jgi:GNAT superfamily N-acetyltransferase
MRVLSKADDVVVPRAVEHAIRRQHAPEHHEARMEEARGYYRDLRDQRRKELAAMRAPDPTGPPQIKPSPAQAARIEQHSARKRQWAVVRRKKRKKLRYPANKYPNKYPSEVTGSEVGKSMRLPDKSIVRFRTRRRSTIPEWATDKYSREFADQARISARRKGREVGQMGVYRQDVGDSVRHGAMHHKKGSVAQLLVEPEYQRQGIGTAMWRHAKKHGLEPKHSHIQTDAGKAWAAKVGKGLPSALRGRAAADATSIYARDRIMANEAGRRAASLMGRRGAGAKVGAAIRRGKELRARSRRFIEMDAAGMPADRVTTPARVRAPQSPRLWEPDTRIGISTAKYDREGQARDAANRAINARHLDEAEQRIVQHWRKDVGKAWERKERHILVTGSRDADYSNKRDRRTIERDLTRQKRLHPLKQVVVHHGGAKGADTIAGIAAEDRRMPEVVHQAHWELHGRAAGPMRNKAMLEHRKYKKVYAYPKGESKGTRGMIKLAQDKGHKVKVRELGKSAEDDLRAQAAQRLERASWAKRHPQILQQHKEMSALPHEERRAKVSAGRKKVAPDKMLRPLRMDEGTVPAPDRRRRGLRSYVPHRRKRAVAKALDREGIAEVRLRHDKRAAQRWEPSRTMQRTRRELEFHGDPSNAFENKVRTSAKFGAPEERDLKAARLGDEIVTAVRRAKPEYKHKQKALRRKLTDAEDRYRKSGLSKNPEKHIRPVVMPDVGKSDEISKYKGYVYNRTRRRYNRLRRRRY